MDSLFHAEMLDQVLFYSNIEHQSGIKKITLSGMGVKLDGNSI